MNPLQAYAKLAEYIANVKPKALHELIGMLQSEVDAPEMQPAMITIPNMTAGQVADNRYFKLRLEDADSDLPVVENQYIRVVPALEPDQVLIYRVVSLNEVEVVLVEA